MFHEKILAKAADYLSGRLDPRDKADLESHLQKCRDCRGLLSRWSLAEPPENFTEQVMSRLPRADVLKAPASRWILRWPVWGTVAAAALVVAAFWRPESGWVRADRYFAFSNPSQAASAWTAPRAVLKGEQHD
jgi:hypothetical protein